MGAGAIVRQRLVWGLKAAPSRTSLPSLEVLPHTISSFPVQTVAIGVRCDSGAAGRMRQVSLTRS